VRCRLAACPRTLWGLLAATALAAVLSACGDDDAAAPPPATSVPPLVALHATRGAQPGIFDAEGRQVLLRGVNLNALGDYYQANPDFPPVIPLRDGDFPEMARYGFNVVRLIVSWSSLEPTRGEISRAYLQRVHAAVDAAKASGVYVVLDMHQDAWGKYIATPPGVSCPPSREVAIGWDGAPEWATLTDGKSTCRNPGVRELAPAVSAAFTNFYADRDGIQGELIGAWAALAREFATEPAVAGYDLLNEPHFTNGPSVSAPLLAAYSGRVITALRDAERQAGGFAHIAFFEPVILWPATGAAFTADFTNDENIVFAPHNYAESLTDFNSLSIEQGFARAAADAAMYGSTFWIGEYGWFSDPPANKPRVVRYAREEDRLLVGGTWWQWRQACGDPHSIGTPGGQPPAELIHFHRTSCPGDVDRGAIPEWATVLSRPYPRAAPGRLLSLQSDGDAGTLQLSGMAAGAGADARLDLWVPQRGGRPLVTGTGLGPVQTISVPGGFRLLIGVSGSYAASIAQR